MDNEQQKHRNTINNPGGDFKERNGMQDYPEQVL